MTTRRRLRWPPPPCRQHHDDACTSPPHVLIGPLFGDMSLHWQPSGATSSTSGTTIGRPPGGGPSPAAALQPPPPFPPPDGLPLLQVSPASWRPGTTRLENQRAIARFSAAAAAHTQVGGSFCAVTDHDQTSCRHATPCRIVTAACPFQSRGVTHRSCPRPRPPNTVGVVVVVSHLFVPAECTAPPATARARVRPSLVAAAAAAHLSVAEYVEARRAAPAMDA